MYFLSFVLKMKLSNLTVFLLLLLAGCVYITGMQIPIMGVDAAQYASMSQQLLQDGNVLELRNRDFEYLDKPPLLFWLSAGSISVFGVNSFAYKLPSVLALLLAVFATFRFCRLEHSRETSLLAALILMCSQAFFIMANDCRTDNLLIGFSMLAVWKLAAYLKNRNNRDLYFGFVAVGLAMLAKGPLGLVFTGFTIGSMMLYLGKKAPINWRWLWAIPIIAVILLPMCIGLYRQHGSKGLEFYFWTQSFGRITGQSRWSNNTDPFFLIHSFIWAFLPFILIFIAAVSRKIKALFSSNNLIWMDYVNLGGFFLTMFALSLSRYKLPHYIFIICPLASVMVATYLAEIQKKATIQRLQIIQSVLLVLLAIGAVAFVTFFNNHWSWLQLAFILPLLGLAWLIYTRFSHTLRIVLLSLLVIMFVNIELNTQFYPKLMSYQSSSEVAFYIKENNIPVDQVAGFHCYGHAFSYYLDNIMPLYGTLEQIDAMKRPAYLYTNQRGLDTFNNNQIENTVLEEFDEYKVSILTGRFLNPKTRPEVIKKRFLVKLP